MDETRSNAQPAPPASNYYKPKSKRMARKWKRQMKPNTINDSLSGQYQKMTDPTAAEREKAATIAKQVGGGGGGTLCRGKEYTPRVAAGAWPGIVIANGSGRPWWPSGGPNDRYIAPNGVVIANGSGRPFDVRMGLLGLSNTTQ